MKIKSSWAVALGIAGLAALWILSGAVVGDDAAESAAPARQQDEPPTRVRTQVLHAGTVQRTLSVYARTQAKRDATLRVETGGRVEDILVAKGERVKKGQVLLRLAMNDRAARRLEAAAGVDQRRLEFEQARKLAHSDYASRTRVAQARAALDAAEAALARIDEEIANVTLKAPFAGVFNENLVEEGEYAAAGDAVARVVEMDPMTVVAEVSERDVESVTVGTRGTVVLNDGREVPGVVTWVSAIASPTTRTYPVDMEVANPDHAIAAGMTAEMHVPLGNVAAHLVSPAVLTLSDTGAVGVKSVDDANRVVFHEVELVADGPDGMWLGGLPDTVQFIVVGQEYVRTGAVVDPVAQTAESVP
jgi:multidrug efflux system membrane fusion protein